MLNQKKIIQSFGIFWIVFLGLTFLFFMPTPRNNFANAHAQLFGGIADKVLTDDIHFVQKKGTEDGLLYFSFFDNRVVEKAKRLKQTKVDINEFNFKNNPTYHINTSLFFLLALCIATPLSLTRRVWLTMITTFLFYCYSSIRLNYKIKSKVLEKVPDMFPNAADGIFSIPRMAENLSILGFIFFFIIVIWAFQVFSASNLKELRTSLMN